MVVGLKTLKVEEFAIHLIIHAPKAAPVQPWLGAGLTPVTAENRSYLEDRFKSTLKGARGVIEDGQSASPVPGMVRDYFEGSVDLLTTSQGLALELQRHQTGTSPSGLLLVASCLLGGDRACLVIAKLEHERGARTREITDAAGNVVYDMEYLQDLFFTEGSQVYKVAIFYDPQGSGTASGEVIDRQSGGHYVAEYFISDFLGCTFMEQADVLTERFFNAVQEFVSAIEDPTRRAEYQVALLTEMRSNKNSISPGGFAKDHLHVDDVSDFAAAIGAANLAMTGSFPKDLTLVKQRLASMQVVFDHGVIATIPPGELGDQGHATMETLDDGTVNLQIHDGVKAIGSRGTPKELSGEAHEE